MKAFWLCAIWLVLLLLPSGGLARGGKAVPRQILGPVAWQTLNRNFEAEVALIEPKADGKFQGQHGLAAVARSRPSRKWVRQLRALLLSPASYYVPRCDRDGRCPQLRCRTTPRAVVTLKDKTESAQLVITVCYALQAGPSLDNLGPQVSMEPAEGRLLKLLRELFPKDQALREAQAERRKARGRHARSR